MIFIQNGYIKTMAAPDIENGCVLLDDNGKIAAVGADLTAPEGAQIIDAEGRLVTPGCVEAHCHIGIGEEIIGWAGSDYNEKSDPITPHMRAIDGIRPEDGRLMAVVKANAYGHGLIEVANALYLIADCFAVSCVEEGMRLRLAGIDKQILVLLPCTLNELECAIENHLTLTVENINQIEKIDKVCSRLKKRAKVHIKVNTGMNRLGCEIEDINNILQYVNKKPNIILDGVFSHLSNPKSKVSVRRAIDKFLLAINAVKVYNKRVTFHISASGGFLRGEYFDMVRIGILLYGYKPFKDSTIKVKILLEVVQANNNGDTVFDAVGWSSAEEGGSQ